MEELIYSIDWEQVKNSFSIFMWGDPNASVVKGWVPIAMAAVQLGISGIQAINASKRRKEALQKYKEDKKALEATKITNPYESVENPYEDLTVNQKQMDFLAQQQQQGLANQMSALRGAAGRSGIGAFAQSLAGQQTRNLQGISGAIGQQEAMNQRLKAQGALQTGAMRAQGEQTRQMREEQRKMGIAGMSQYQAAIGQQAYNQAIGGVGSAVGQLGGAVQDQLDLNQLEKDRLNFLNKINTDNTASGGGGVGNTAGKDWSTLDWQWNPNPTLPKSTPYPQNPTEGQIWKDPNTGIEFKYNGWQGWEMIG